MQNPAFRAYLENKVLTASPEQLQLMLYEGAIRFARAAQMALAERNFESAQESFERVDGILGELLSGLRPEMSPEICEQYAALYMFCSRKLNEAHFRHDPALVDQAMPILQNLRDTWVLLLEKLMEEKTEESAPEYPAEGEYDEPLALRTA